MTQPDGGFTLVEALVAFVIVAVGVAVALPLFSDTLTRNEDAITLRMAVSVARSKLAETGVLIPLAGGTNHGTEADRYRWRVDIAEAPQVLPENPLKIGAYEVTVSVAWGADNAERSIALRTLRLGPRP